MSLVVNALIGFANVSTIAVSGFMKLPQVYSLIKSKSPAGVSLQSLLLEFSGYLIMMSYNFYSKYPLASYFEYPLLVIQDLIMLLIMLHLLDLYSSSLFVPLAGALGLIIGIGWGYLPKMAITVLVNLCTPLSASSKVVQLRSILTKKDSTGVSVTTWLISSYSCVTRLFTIYVESFDVPLLCNFFVSLILNLAVVVAAKVYAPRPLKGGKETDRRRKKQE